MAIHANRKRVVIPITVLSAGALAASALGVTTKVNAAPDPGKASAGPYGSLTVDPPNIGPGSCYGNFHAAPGVRVGDHVLVQAPWDLDYRLATNQTTQPLPDNLWVRICNVHSVNSVDDGAKPWTYMVLR